MKARHILAAGLVLAAPAWTRPSTPAPDAAQPKELATVLGCRAIANPTERLACYDRGADALQAATDKRDIVVVDRESVRRTQRSLFGFDLPTSPLFGNDKTDPAAANGEDREMSATVRSARLGPDAFWIVVLDDGAVWHQTDGTLALSPKPGNSVIIRRAALGSYFMRVNKQPGVKARREG